MRAKLCHDESKWNNKFNLHKCIGRYHEPGWRGNAKMPSHYDKPHRS